MKSFEKLFEEISNNNITYSETWKEFKSKNKNIHIISFIISVIILAFFCLAIRYVDIIFCIIGGLIIFIITNMILSSVTGFKKKREGVNIYFKDNVIKPLMSNFFNNVNFYPQKGIPESVYRNCNYGYYEDFYSSDYMTGFLNEFPIVISEVKTEKEETDSDGDSYTVTVFNGLFVKIDLKKSIKAYCIIKDNALFNSNNLELDNVEFEKKFDVYTDNDIIAMRLLTSDVMQLLLDFKKNNNIGFDIYINNDQLYLRFHSGNMFEFNQYNSEFLDKNLIHRYYSVLNFVYELSFLFIDLINSKDI